MGGPILPPRPPVESPRPTTAGGGCVFPLTYQMASFEGLPHLHGIKMGVGPETSECIARGMRSRVPFDCMQHTWQKEAQV